MENSTELTTSFGQGFGWILRFFLSVCVAYPARVYFSFQQQKEKYQKKVPPKIKSFDKLRIPHDFGLALRCGVELRRALIGGMALVLLPIRNFDLGLVHGLSNGSKLTMTILSFYRNCHLRH